MGWTPFNHLATKFFIHPFLKSIKLTLPPHPAPLVFLPTYFRPFPSPSALFPILLAVTLPGRVPSSLAIRPV